MPTWIRYVIAIAVGITAQYFLPGLAAFDRPFGHSQDFYFWVSPIYGLASIAPGVIVGFIAIRKGVWCGALAVLLAETLRNSLWAVTTHDIETVLSPDQHPGLFDYLHFVGSAIWLSLQSAFVGGASGALGQLLRSNKSLERTREE